MKYLLADVHWGQVDGYVHAHVCVWCMCGMRRYVEMWRVCMDVQLCGVHACECLLFVWMDVCVMWTDVHVHGLCICG